MNRIPKDKSLMKTISWKTKGGDYKFIKVKIQDVWFFIDSWSWKENKKEETNEQKTDVETLVIICEISVSRS